MRSTRLRKLLTTLTWKFLIPTSPQITTKLRALQETSSQSSVSLSRWLFVINYSAPCNILFSPWHATASPWRSPSPSWTSFSRPSPPPSSRAVTSLTWTARSCPSCTTSGWRPPSSEVTTSRPPTPASGAIYTTATTTRCSGGPAPLTRRSSSTGRAGLTRPPSARRTTTCWPGRSLSSPLTFLRLQFPSR